MRGRRLFAASEARAAGWGGRAAVSEITGVAQSTIGYGLAELDAQPLDRGRVRRSGGGRKSITQTDPTVVEDLRLLVEPATMGDPMRALLWVSKSHEKLAFQLAEMGHDICPNTVGRLLTDELEFSRQANRKTLEGARHPDCNASRRSAPPARSSTSTPRWSWRKRRASRSSRSTRRRKSWLATTSTAAPIIGRRAHPSVSPGGAVFDSGPRLPRQGAGQGGTLWRLRSGRQRSLGPRGEAVFDSVGITCDTAEFAVQSIWTWRNRMGLKRYPGMSELTITADGGGSNGARVRLWKVELQKFADETGMTMNVHHYPPGTSKWNKIEHRLFCHITQTWRAKPLESRAAVVELIAATTTKTGLKVESALDVRTYEKGIKVSDAEMAQLDIRGDAFHPEWNYSVYPRPK